MKPKFLDAPFWSISFRPFFTLVFINAIVSALVWTLQFTGLHSFDFSPLSAAQWHANEMIFGFLYSAVIGFLLTASANWTGVRGIHGRNLFLLVGLYILTRLVFWTMPLNGMEVYRVLSLLVPLFIVVYLAQLFLQTKNYKNLVMLVPLGVLALSQFLILSSNYILGYELAIYSIRFLVIVIAGRVIPFFTKSVLKLEPRWKIELVDRFTVVVTLVLIFEPFFSKQEGLGQAIWVGLTTLALVLNVYRLVNWRFLASAKVGILFVLYLAYSWLPIHFLLNLMVSFGWLSGLGKPELHSLVYGCMGLMIIGIVNRVSLGHTGRFIKASSLSLVAFGALGLGSLGRVFGPLLSPMDYLIWVRLSGLLWVLAFMVIGFEIIPILFKAREDAKDY